MLVHRVSFILKTIESYTKLGFYSVRLCAKSLPGRAASSTISTRFSSFIQSQTRVASNSARALSRRGIILTHLQSRGLSRRSSTMAGTSASGNDDISYSRPQQSPLASQRGKQNTGPSEGNQSQAAKSGGFFPLGFKEGFSQWVWGAKTLIARKTLIHAKSGQAFLPLQQSTESCRTSLIFDSLRHRPNQVMQCLLNSHRHHWCRSAAVRATPPQRRKHPPTLLAPANGTQTL